MKTLALSLGTSFNRASRRDKGVLNRISTWMNVSRERDQLADLDPRLLADIGISREDAAHEVARPFWDVAIR